jgi:hypothetical protein
VNATDYFERRHGNRLYPACSESFWSTVFAFFLLHLAQTRQDIRLRVWEPTQQPPRLWYKPKRDELAFDVTGLVFEGIAVEPTTVAGVWPDIDITLTGIAPDLFLRFDRTKGTYVFVETKVTTGASLNSNQESNYPALVTRLAARGTDVRLLILKSIGCCSRLYAQSTRLQGQLGDRFGILIWEEVFREMRRSKFSLPGLDTESLQAYPDASSDCDAW